MSISPRSLSPLLLFAACITPLAAQTIQAPFNQNYSVRSLGQVPGVPLPYGGVTFRYDDLDVLLIGGNANRTTGKIYEIRVSRNANGEIDGFIGTATVYADAPNNDGGLQFGPGNVLFYSRYNLTEIGQIKPGSTAPDKVIQLRPLGWQGGSPGALTFVPPGYPSTGNLKICGYSGGPLHDSTITPDGNGTFDITGLSFVLSGLGGVEGLLYPPPGSPQLTDYGTLVVSNYGGASIDIYDIDAQANPILSTRQVFMNGVGGAEGATVDASSGGFVFSTFGTGSQVLVVDGFGSCGTFANYGSGLPGAGGQVPALRGTGCATINRAIDFGVTNGPPGATGSLNVGQQQLNLPIFGGFLHTEPTVTISHQLNALGEWSAPLFAPNDPAIVGQIVFFQAVYIDQAAPFLVTGSPGLAMLVL